MHADMRRKASVGRRRVEEAQRPVPLVESIGAHVPCHVLVHRIQVGLRGIDRDIRRIRRRHDLQLRQVSIARIHPENVDADGGARVRAAWRNVGGV